jgi:proteasome lid subunit RPN8/RPN11
MTINISSKALNVIIEHSQATYPLECCGFFFGKDSDDGQRIIDLALPVKNSKEGDQRRRFEISPKDYMDAELYALANNYTLQGVYHSHPDHPAIPSQHDLNQAFPFFSYIIVSVKDGTPADITSWRLNDEKQFIQEVLKQNQKA